MPEQRIYQGLRPAERTALRRRRLLEATLDLLTEGGLASVSVRAVCAGAQLTSRYFYESFADLDALLLTLVDEVADEIATAGLAKLASHPNDAYLTARAALEAAVAVMIRDPRKGKLMLVAAAGHEPLRRRYHEVMLGYAALIRQQSRDFYGPQDLTAEDAELTALFVIGGLSEMLMGWLGGAVDVPRERLVDHAAHLFAAAGQIRSG